MKPAPPVMSAVRFGIGQGPSLAPRLDSSIRRGDHNVHHRSEGILGWSDDYAGSLEIVTIVEHPSLGTAGDVGHPSTHLEPGPR